VTNAEFREWLAKHGFSQRAFARRVNVDERRVHAWVSGENGLPALLPVVLEYLQKEARKERR
jgi:DNA-binding transcriptional regulator YiaG